MKKFPTYTNWVLLQLLPAPDWQAVYVDDDGRHFANTIHALALAERRDRFCETGELLTSSAS